MSRAIKAENINCGGSMNSIKTAMLKIANVQEVSIDKHTEMVHISSTVPFNRKEITNQPAKMGCHKTGNNNLLHKAKSFVCCAISNLTEKA